MRRLSENLIDTLVEFHQIDYVKAGLGHIGKPGGLPRSAGEGLGPSAVKASPSTEEVPGRPHRRDAGSRPTSLRAAAADPPAQ